MIDPTSLTALAAVLRTGSFDAAAAEMALTQSAISQRVRGLEDRLGVTLIRRTRPATPTEAGRRLLAHAETVGLLEQELARDLSDLLPERHAPLRIAVTADSLATWVPAALAEVEGLVFDLVIDDQNHSAELLRAGDVAAAITVTETPVTGCDAYPLGPLHYVSFCAPGFRDRWFPRGATADALSQAPLLTFNRKDRLQLDWITEVMGVRLRPRTHYIGSTHAITDAAIAGLGWAVNPAPLIEPHLARGALVEVAPGHRLATPLCWQVPRRHSGALAPLTRAVRRAAARART